VLGVVVVVVLVEVVDVDVEVEVDVDEVEVEVEVDEVEVDVVGAVDVVVSGTVQPRPIIWASRVAMTAGSVAST
jgi:hypothetical protein